MAPRDESEKVSPPPSPSTLHVNVWNRFVSIRVFRSTKDFYEKSKKTAFVGTGLTMVEKGVEVLSAPLKCVAAKMAETYPDAVGILDHVACDWIDVLEAKVPVLIQQPAEGIMKKVKVCTNRSLRKAFRSYLGRLLLRGINSTLDLSEKLLYQLTPNPTLELPAIAPPPPTGSPENRRYIKFYNRKKLGVHKVFGLTMVRTLVLPLQLWVRVCQYIKKFFETMMSKHHRSTALKGTTLSDAKKKEIAKRKKVSPRKRKRAETTVTRLMNIVLATLGHSYNPGRHEDIQVYVVADTEPKKQEQKTTNANKASEKRKHDEVSDFEEIGISALDNLDDYDSADDSDYLPNSEECSIDSLEFCEGDTESDLEASVGPGNFKALKEATSDPDRKTVKEATSDPDCKTAKEATSDPDRRTAKDVTSGPGHPTMKDITSDPGRPTMKDVTGRPTMKDITSGPDHATTEDVVTDPAHSKLEDPIQPPQVANPSMVGSITDDFTVIDVSHTTEPEISGNINFPKDHPKKNSPTASSISGEAGAKKPKDQSPGKQLKMLMMRTKSKK